MDFLAASPAARKPSPAACWIEFHHRMFLVWPFFGIIAMDAPGTLAIPMMVMVRGLRGFSQIRNMLGTKNLS
jgi:hypothetical protein